MNRIRAARKGSTLNYPPQSFADRLKVLIGNTAGATAMFDVGMRYLAWSKRWLIDYRLPDRSLLGLCHYDVFPEIGEDWKAVHKRCLAGAVECREDDPFVRADGQVDYVRWSVQPWRGEDGLVGGIVISTDVMTGRKRTEEDLARTEAYYHALFEAANDAVFVHGIKPDGSPDKFIAVNNLTAERLGYSEEELLALTPLDIDADLQRDERLRKVERMVRRGNATFERVHVAKDGRRIPVEISSRRFNQGGRTFVVSIARDITARKSVESALRAANEELAAIQAHAPIVFVVVDSELNIQKVNETAAKLVGKPEAALLGQRPGEALGCLNSLADPRGCGHGAACSDCALRGAVMDTLQTGRPHDDVEASVPLGDGDGIAKKWLLVFTAPLETVGCRKVLVSILDITARKQAEHDLRISESRFRTVTEEAPIAISISREGKVIYGNPEYLRMFGYKSVQDLQGIPTIELFAPQCRREVAERATRRAQGLPVPRAYEAVGRRADGSEFPALVAVSTMELAEGPALVGFITDLTATYRAAEERMRLEEQFRQAQKLESIGRLAGGVAHDFNNLLTVINGYSALLLNRMDQGDPMWRSLLEIRKAGDRAAGLTQQLLAFSRKQVLKPSQLELNSVLTDMQPMLARLMGEDIELNLDLDPRATTIFADRNQLEQVLMNLTVNARDAMPHGGNLSIRTAALAGDHSQADPCSQSDERCYVLLAVSDTGVGMDEETCRRIFEPFFTTKGLGKGTGLGLSMVQGIVLQSGGRIDVTSQPGQGTTFSIYLPMAGGPVAAAAAAPREEASALGSGEATILVVEDQAEVSNFAAEALESHGYRVIQTASGAEALKICERQDERIDLVMTDVIMPRMNGRELADRIRKLRPRIKILFVSGYADEEILAHKALDADASFFPKPFTPKGLAARVRELLGPDGGD